MEFLSCFLTFLFVSSHLADGHSLRNDYEVRTRVIFFSFALIPILQAARS